MYRISLILILLFSQILNAQIKNVTVSTPGTLSNLITTAEKTSISTLTVNGSIDVRDILFIRDNIRNVATLNLSNASIKAYSGTDGTYPGILQSYAANALPDYAFYNPYKYTYKSSLVTIYLPVSLVSIGKQAFYFCWNLEGTLTLPSSLNAIGSLAFYGCYALSTFSIARTNTRYSTNNGVLYNKNADTLLLCPNAKTGDLILPSTVTHIYGSSFENCYNLTSVTLPSSLLSIGKYAFANCSGISGTLTLPSNLKKIDNWSFYGCYNLTKSIVIPASLTELGTYCFLESNNITDFIVSTSNTDYCSINGALYSKNADTLFICPPAKTGTFTIPETVKLIGSHTFYNCSQLSGTITIPANVDYIGYYAFYGCKNLSAFQVDAANKYFSASNNYLYSLDKSRLIAVPALATGTISFDTALRTIDPAALNNCTKLNGNVAIPQNLDFIGAYAFYNCTGLSSFSVDPNNQYFTQSDGILYNQAQDTLWICPLAKSGIVSLPSTVKYIGVSAFDGCKYISELILPGQLEQIGKYAFEYCTGINNISLPSTLDSIGHGSFFNCTALKTINASMINPPTLDYYALDQIDKTNCTLNIPIATAGRYTEAPYWRDFTNIKETLFNSGKMDIENSKVEYSFNGGFLTLFNTKPGDDIRIYSLQGNLLYQSVADSETHFAYFVHKGIFVLKMNNSAVLIKN